MKTALVLGGGGMFGAYQAGVWDILAGRWEPDLVVGASIGSVNGWAIASRIAPDRLREMWMQPGEVARRRWRWPRSWWDGVLDSEPFEHFLKDLTHRHHPRVEYALVVTEWPALRKRVYRWPEADWRLVAASCSMPGLFPQPRLHGRRLSDGGLLGSLPLWAAARLGATHILGVGLLGHGADWRGGRPPGVHSLVIEPPRPMGTWRDMFRWSRSGAEQYIEAGRRDALAAWPAAARMLGFESQ